jgi:hypothetical protein
VAPSGIAILEATFRWNACRARITFKSSEHGLDFR